MPGPIATQGSMHVCPMSDGPKPHVGGPVIGPGAINILVNNKPAALIGDICTCVGPPDMIAQGAPNVFFNGVPVACQGDMTAHGGVITVGEPNVIIGSATLTPSTTLELNKIPFPQITLANRQLEANQGAITNQEKLKEEAKKHGVLGNFSISL
ncbi:PAAR domain-containing protein [Cellulophaga sp. HaHa_2_95]|uniref:PAAR domain-containing protein n=1 Tax=Cellulophaga sp. HaHa_2_95 TaxID=2745558 RepID=UPI001C4EA253|nr:PAAR domain-containing protein [Cellulophaga sp. HaHa_2_95]QXP54516.1 PAAR domain-containing protein [Cellulophaga sp. HaHa_2_95]